MKRRAGGYLVLCAAVFALSCPGCGRQKSDPQRLAEQSEQYFKKAVDAYTLQLAKDPQDESVRVALGRLYYGHGRHSEARQLLADAGSPQAAKIRALSAYRQGEFRDALEVFNRLELDDDEYRYYHGLTAQRLNLYDQALEAYREVSSGEYRQKALERIAGIEKDLVAGVQISSIDPGAHQIITGAPDAKEYPQAGALILSCDEEIEVTDDYRQITTLHYIIKILNERGKDDFSETHISYDSTFEKVELLSARTIKPDGTVVEVGDRHIRDVTRYLNFPLYSNVRVFIISFPEVAADAVIEYRVRIHNNRLIDKDDFVMSYTVQAPEPIIDCSFTVRMPRAKPLCIEKRNERYNTFGAVLDPQIEEREDALVYRWRFRDIPQVIPEPAMPPGVEINPSFLLSTFSDWSAIYGWWQELVADKTEADAAIREAVAGLIDGAQSPEERIRRIYHYCAQQIRYVAVEYGQAGYEPHKAADIFRNKYGDCKDQAVLLVTMLREAGLEAWPVLIATRDYFDLHPDFPSVLFNHAIAAVEFEGTLTFLDPTAETCSFADLPSADQGRSVLVFKDDGHQIVSTPLFGPAHNLVKHLLRITLGEDESMRAQKSVFTEGVYAQSQRYWLLYTQPERVTQSLKERIQGISVGGSLRDYSIDNLTDLNKPIVLRYSFEGPEYMRRAGPLRILPPAAWLDASLVALGARRYPLDFGFLDTKINECVIEIPHGFAVEYMPLDAHEETPWFDYSLKYSQSGERIEAVQELVYKKTVVPVEEYARFKEILERLAVQAKETIVLKKEPGGVSP